MPSHRPMIVRAVLLFGSVLTAGCSVSTTPMPALDGPLAIQVSREPISSRRFGSYQVPGTAVYVSGHQGESEIGMVFGPIGLLAGHYSAQSTGERKVAATEPHLTLDVAALTETVVREELATRADGQFAGPGARAAATLEMKPYVVINSIGNDRARLWVALQTTLKGASQKWKLQYIAGVGEPRPWVGEGSWAADEGAAIREAIDRNLRLAVAALLRDASHALPRDGRPLVAVDAHWLWMKEPRSRPALLLDRTEHAVIVLPCAYEKDADGFVHTGLTILDPRAVTVRSVARPGDECLGKHVDIN